MNDLLKFAATLTRAQQLSLPNYCVNCFRQFFGNASFCDECQEEIKKWNDDIKGENNEYATLFESTEAQ